MFGLPLTEVARIVMAMHGLRPHQERAVLARLKQMQRLQFPKRDHGGRGRAAS